MSRALCVLLVYLFQQCSCRVMVPAVASIHFPQSGRVLHKDSAHCLLIAARFLEGCEEVT